MASHSAERLNVQGLANHSELPNSCRSTDPDQNGLKSQENAKILAKNAVDGSRSFGAVGAAQAARPASTTHAAELPPGCLLLAAPDDALEAHGIARGSLLLILPVGGSASVQPQPGEVVAARTRWGVVVRRYSCWRLGWLRLTADEEHPAIWVEPGAVVGVVIGVVEPIQAELIKSLR